MKKFLAFTMGGSDDAVSGCLRRRFQFRLQYQR